MLYGTAQVNGRGRSPPSSEDRISVENLMDGCDFFAIYDGHSGAEVANQCKAILYKEIQEAIRVAGSDILDRREDMAALLKRVFIDHNKYLASIIDKLDDSGSTASVALVTRNYIYLAYLGDSPCFMMHPQTGHIIEEMGKHEPSLAVETARIEAAGGFVEIDEYGIPRVDGMLAVSRAFGDFSLAWKGRGPPANSDWTKMKITAHPDVMTWDRPVAGVLALMSDGLVETDSATTKPLAQVAHDIQKGLGLTGYNLKGAADKVLGEHVRQGSRGRKYSGDDLSLILVDVGTGVMMGGVATAPVKAHKPPTRKSKGRRRIRTEKQSRLIKIFSC
jgi:serine/threonine protein phosphatase PrpC